MQTLSFLGAGRILTKWAAGLYRSIAAIYTDMLNLVDTFNDSPLAETLNNISANVYVLVGVFMLFRIGVSLLNYLVDPSKLDDKKVGGGQLVTHILISIVLLLSLNFVFKWTNDLQTILLERDGILYKIISTGNAEMSKLNDLQLINTQEVSVVSKKYKDNENICNNTATIKAALKEHIINNIRDGCFTKKYTRAEAEKLVNSVSITYNSSGRELTGISGSIDETSLKGLNAKVSVKYKNQVGQSVSGTKPNFHLTNATCYFNFPLSRDYSDNSLDSISGFHVEYYCDSSKSDEVEKSIEGIENKKEQQIRKDQGKYDNSSIEESGFEFATITLSTFMSPSDEVDDTILKQYSGEKSSDWWADRIEDEQKSSSGITYSMDWLLAFICGLAIIAVLIAIMMEVVVRNLKLVFLQAIAPIPVVSYMNPNDKLLGTWVKQYIGVYFSLFIQLFVILIIPDLMMKLLDSVTGGFILKIVIIAGCLLFTKEAPKFIGKLLGLDNMEGSFGDAFKMVKTGLGIGAGAAAGAVAGAFTGAGAGGSLSTFMGGMLGGAFRGASSGAQGKIFEGAGKQIKRNNAAKDASKKGLNWWDRQKGKSAIGKASLADMDRNIEKHKKEAAKQGRMVSFAESAKEKSLDVLQKGKADNLGGIAGQYRKRMDQFAQADAERKNIVRSNFSSDSEYQSALKKANDNYENIRSSIYGKNYARKADGSFIEIGGEIHQDDDGNFFAISSTGGRIDGIVSDEKYSFEDAAIAETFNKSDDDNIKNLKAAAEIDLSEFGINVKDYLTVKGAGSKSKTIAAEETAKANAIENSEEYQKLKIAQGLNDSK